MTTNFNNQLEYSYKTLPKSLYKEVSAKNFDHAKILILNEPLAENLKINTQFLLSKKGLKSLFGHHENKSKTIALAYAGHQYGYYTTLGDGRALLIGEYLHDNKRFDFHLKGSGKTPYSRNGDGRATLKSCLREYLISEAMHALDIPTTRSMAVIDTGDKIRRSHYENAGVLVRVARSHIRVGTFEYAKRKGMNVLKPLADYTINRHFPFLNSKKNKYKAFYDEVIKKQAYLIAKWQSFGFIHGVMNTDNMAVSGETIDYGPCAFMNEYDPKTVFSSIDRYGRYAYANQPVIAQWNLARLGETLIPLLKTTSKSGVLVANNCLEKFNSYYDQYWLELMTNKIGIKNHEKKDKLLITQLLEIMHKHQLDFTNTFRKLNLGIDYTFNDELKDWLTQWRQRLEEGNDSKASIIETMNKANPSIIPRNYLVEQALNAGNSGDMDTFSEYLKALMKPFDEKYEGTYLSKPPTLEERIQQTYCET